MVVTVFSDFGEYGILEDCVTVEKVIAVPRCQRKVKATRDPILRPMAIFVW